MQVPSHPTNPSDQIFVLLSIWDDADSYDQIGIESIGPLWSVTYSYTTGPCTSLSFHSDDNIAFLAEGQVYFFKMTLQAGTLSFLAQSQGVTIWSKIVATSASRFLVERDHTCADGTVKSGYTNYEEVWKVTDQNVPNWSFRFFDNSYGGTSATTWAFFRSGTVPPQVVTYAQGDDVTIANHFFALGGPTFRKIGQGFTLLTLSEFVIQMSSPGDCQFVSCQVGLSTPVVPPGWSITIFPVSGTPTFLFTLGISIPYNAGFRVYDIEVRADNPAHAQWTTLWIRVTVTGGGGWSCVARDTPILTPTGDVLVQKLSPGSLILSYNVANGTFTTSTLLWRNASSSDRVFQIDSGILRVTQRDQPLYMKNETFTGWLQDPQELEIGALLFRPVTNDWLVVYSLDFYEHTTTVYDIVPSFQGTAFVANGILSNWKG